MPGARCQVPGVGCQVQVPGVGCQVPDTPVNVKLRLGRWWFGVPSGVFVVGVGV